MSDNRPKKERGSRGAPTPDGPGWFEELRERVAEWVDPILNPPMPAPVPVRRHR